MPNHIEVGGATVHVGDRMIATWRHWAGNEGARFATVKKITAAGFIYAGYSDERYKGDVFPLQIFRPKGEGPRDYHHCLVQNTETNRTIYKMDATAPDNKVFKKPRPAKAAP